MLVYSFSLKCRLHVRLRQGIRRQRETRNAVFHFPLGLMSFVSPQWPVSHSNRGRHNSVGPMAKLFNCAADDFCGCRCPPTKVPPFWFSDRNNGREWLLANRVSLLEKVSDAAAVVKILYLRQLLRSFLPASAPNAEQCRVCHFQTRSVVWFVYKVKNMQQCIRQYYLNVPIVEQIWHN